MYSGFIICEYMFFIQWKFFRMRETMEVNTKGKDDSNTLMDACDL